MGRAKASPRNLLLAYTMIDSVTEPFEAEKVPLSDFYNFPGRINYRGESSLYSLIEACAPDLIRISPETGLTNRHGITETELNRHLKHCGFVSCRERRRASNASTYRWRNRNWKALRTNFDLVRLEAKLEGCAYVFARHAVAIDIQLTISMIQQVLGFENCNTSMVAILVPRSRFFVNRRIILWDDSQLRWPVGLDRVSPSMGPLLHPFLMVRCLLFIGQFRLPEI